MNDFASSKRKFESSIASNKKTKSVIESVRSMKKGDSGGYAPTCFNCDQKGHLSHNCTIPSSNKITYFNSRKEGHQKSDCPELFTGENRHDNIKRLEKTAGLARGRNYLMTSQDANKSNEVVSGTFMVNSKPAKALFESGADTLYVSLKYAAKLDCPISDIDSLLQVEIVDGRFSVAVKVYKICVIYFGVEKFDIDLVPITFGEFNVPVGMDWFNRYRANVACHEKFVRVRTPSGGELIMYGEARR
ncbi:uncharacterized protein [Rutidosis leptorrhynchoides]|uniref:uncharacterized protein n=1 Tax=Rutidosis leptorrhynchoides TaxID=125765 RepID=UPI003A9A0D26